jgi:hypothetical protein
VCIESGLKEPLDRGWCQHAKDGPDLRRCDGGTCPFASALLSQLSNRHAMANGPLPELLRDLGIETLLDDPETLHRMAEVALDRAGLAANGRAPEEYRLEIELFEWCTKRLALLAAEDSVLHAAAPSTLRH